MLIAIDAGHNCSPDTGATGLVQEDVWTKELAKVLISKLNNLNINTVDVTPYGEKVSNVSASLERRCNRANNANADMYIALHFNVTPGGTGTEIYAISDKAKIIANKILPEICNALGYYNRGVKEENLFVLKYTNMPAILIEGCFIDNKSDVAKYDVNKMANAIVKGITGQTVTTKVPCPNYCVKYNPNKYDPNVKLIQAKLNISSDGYFGMQTLIAVQKFQKSNNLQQDGIVGAITWTKLFN